MLSSDIAEGLLKGVLTALLPGLHPLLLPFSSEVSISVAYGIYSALSSLPSVFLGAFSSVTAYTAIVAHRLVRRGRGAHALLLYAAGALLGILFPLFYYPLTDLLSIRLPAVLMFLFLLFVAVLTVLRSRNPLMAALLATMYGTLGIIVLQTPFPVSQPLTISIASLFGASTVLIALFSRERFRYGREGRFNVNSLLRGGLFGFITAFVIAYFPAVSLSVAAFMIQPLFRVRDEEMMVATGSSASSSLFLTAAGKVYGLVRSSFAAGLPETPYIPRVFASLAFGVSTGVLLLLLLSRALYSLYSRRLLKVVAVFTVLAVSYGLSGIAGLLLSVSMMCAGTLTHLLGVEKRVAMFFLLIPTLAYYAPI